MAYQLSSVTIRTSNTEEGMKQIDALWGDITSGKLPVLFDSDGEFQPGISPVSRYSNYQSDDSGEYDLSILGVPAVFFQELEQATGSGRYKKYDASADGLGACAREAWSQVWNDQRAGTIKRSFTTDYESTVPAAYTKDGKCHCYLYIAIE